MRWLVRVVVGRLYCGFGGFALRRNTPKLRARLLEVATRKRRDRTSKCVTKSANSYQLVQVGGSQYVAKRIAKK